MPIKLISIYAPPHHPHGTVQETKDSPHTSISNLLCDNFSRIFPAKNRREIIAGRLNHRQNI
jgi:hypothetical protein